MADTFPPLPKGATFEAPPLPAGATFEPPASVSSPSAPAATPEAAPDRRRATISGQMRRMREPGFVPPAMPKPLSARELGQQYIETGAGALKGAPAGVIGMPGDIESFGRMFVPGATRESIADTVLPTSERVGTAIFGEPETESERLGRTLGTMIGPNIFAKAAGRAAKGAVGSTQPVVTALSKKAEDLGFVLEPAQLRPDRPIGSPGFTEASKIKNENIATKLASRATGAETENITPEFLKSRTKNLGGKYDQIFGRKFDIDADLVRKMEEMKNLEQAVNPAGVGPVKTTADNIINRWKDEVTASQQKTIENNIRRIMQKQGRGGVDPIVRLRRDWPTIRDSSAANVPDWLPGVEKTINELSSSLGLKVTPKVWVSAPRRPGLYGMATGDGNIIINDAVDMKGAVATALHEFGHQAEFQLFMNAAPETRRSVIQAWNDQMASIPIGKKTIEQFRPLTAEKYGEEARTKIPTIGEERGYQRSFAEWFAEQTSRWITTTKAPTNTVEKFFAKIADSWKKIYQRVTGYVPMVKEVDDFFRSNWKGDLLEDTVRKEAGTPESPVALPEGDVKAKIDGEQLQRLRSNLTRIARTAADSADRKKAGEMVEAIDAAIARYNPEVARELAQTNRQYAATMALADGIEKKFVQQGKVSLEGMGDYLANKIYGFGSGTSTHPLYDLGYMGRTLGIRSRVEGARLPSYDAIAALLGRSRQFIGSTIGTRTQAARRIQRGEEAIPADVKDAFDALRRTGAVAGQEEQADATR